MIFGLSLPLAFAIYGVIWWLTFLALLPLGIRSNADVQEQTLPGNDPGAPVLHGLRRKLILTTLVAFFFWSIVAANSHFGWITFAKLPGADKLY